MIYNEIKMDKFEGLPILESPQIMQNKIYPQIFILRVKQKDFSGETFTGICLGHYEEEYIGSFSNKFLLSEYKVFNGILEIRNSNYS